MWKTYSVVACLVLVVVGSLWGQLSLAAAAKVFPPTPISGSFDLPANTLAPGQCAFDVRISFSGKAGVINLPGGRKIFTFPQLRATVTNLSDTTKSVNLSITGAFHESVQSDGNILCVLTGRNLALDPVAGFKLVIGTFSLVFDSSKTNVIQPLTGTTGQLISVCDLIS